MVTIEILATKEQLQIVDESVKYVKQANDMGDITTQNASYSWNMKIAKTPNNTRILDGLGIVGDTSNKPYRKVYCRLLDNGVAIVLRGLLNIQETNDWYKAHVQEGIIEFFKDIKDDNIGDTIDLSSLNHENTATNIIDSFDNGDDTYKYILADYNGVPRNLFLGVTDLDTTSLVPALNVKWLFDKIFEHYNWTHVNLPSGVAKLWMTYPNALSYETASELSVMTANLVTETSQVNDTHDGPDTHLQDGRYMQTVVFTWNRQSIIAEYGRLSWYSGPVIAPTSFTVYKNGIYKIRWKLDGKYVVWSPYGREYVFDFPSRIMINGNEQARVEHNTKDPDTWAEDTVELQAGDIVTVFTVNDFPDRFRMNPEGCGFEVALLGVQNVNFTEALVKYKTKDFFKEIMLRFSLTAFIDSEKREIVFRTLNERMTAPYENWTKKYVRRISERYTYENYARNNWLRHKYSDENRDYADGNLRVDNENLELEKDVFVSKTYAPDEESAIWTIAGGDFLVPSLKMFDIEVKINEAGDVIGNYKGLKDRFFIIEKRLITENIYIQGNLATSFPLAVKKTWKEVVATQYTQTKRMLTDTRIHEIELALSKFDVQTLDLKKRYYFDQEKNFYLLNKLTFVSDRTCIGEFIRITNG